MIDASPIPTQYPIRRLRGVRVPMPDGVTLAADLFLPDAPGRWPVVLEYLPYRKNDTTWRGWHRPPLPRRARLRGRAARRARHRRLRGDSAWTSTACRSNSTASRRSPGWPKQPWSQRQRRPCSAPPTAASTRSRSPCTARRRSRRSARCTSPTAATPTTATTRAARCRCSTMSAPTGWRWSGATCCRPALT